MNAANASSPTTALETNSCTSPPRSRMVAKISLPGVAHAASPGRRRSTSSSVSVPGSRSPTCGAELGERVRAVEAVRVRAASPASRSSSDLVEPLGLLEQPGRCRRARASTSGSSSLTTADGVASAATTASRFDLAASFVAGMLRSSPDSAAPGAASSRRRCGRRFPALRLEAGGRPCRRRRHTERRPATVERTAVRRRSGSRRHRRRVRPAGVDHRGAAISSRSEQPAGGARRHAARIGLRAGHRAGVPIHAGAAPLGSWYFPTSITAMPLERSARSGSTACRALIGAGQVVMVRHRQASAVRRQGDMLDLVAATVRSQQFRVGRVAPDDEVGGTEIVMSTGGRPTCWARRATSVLISGQFDRGRARRRCRQSSAHEPIRRRGRAQLGSARPRRHPRLARTKKMVGEPSYQVSSGDADLDGRRPGGRISPGRRVLLSSAIPIRARCNKTMTVRSAPRSTRWSPPDLARQSTSPTPTRTADASTPRFSRIVGRSSVLSRHTWARRWTRTRRRTARDACRR